MQQDYGRNWLSEFTLRGGLIHANHGSYGAVPVALRAAQQALKAEFDANPTGFLRQIYPQRIRAAAESVASFLGGQADDWVFVENATTGVNAVLASLVFASGDEILTTDQGYNAVRNAVAARCRQTDATSVEIPVPLPVRSENDLFRLILDATTSRTRLVILDHISSPCGIVFPIARLSGALRDKGILVLVDGAHGPGNLDVDMDAINADFYTGNLHKWVCAPPGCAVLWVRRDHQASIRPMVVSHGYFDGYSAAFDWPGTRDPSTWLCAPAAIAFHTDLGGAELRRRNHATAVAAAARITDRFDSELAGPPSLQSAMVAVSLRQDRAVSRQSCARLQRWAEEELGVVVAFNAAAGSTWLRLSAAVYSEADDLFDATERVFSATLPDGID